MLGPVLLHRVVLEGFGEVGGALGARLHGLFERPGVGQTKARGDARDAAMLLVQMDVLCAAMNRPTWCSHGEGRHRSMRK